MVFYPRTTFYLAIAAAAMASLSPTSVAFTPHMSTHKSTSLSATKPLETAEFEYQELKIQLSAMQQQKVKSVNLVQQKRQELEGYVRRIVNRRPSPVPLITMGKKLPGTKWKLVFTTQALAAELPMDATIVLEFIDDKTLNYALEFSKKTLGLNRITAKSSYTVDTTPVNPGLVTFTYDSITTDVFGMSNIGVGFFGLLKGKTSGIQTSFYDDKLWIERGFDQTNNGMEYFNVYVLEEPEEGDWSG